MLLLVKKSSIEHRLGYLFQFQNIPRQLYVTYLVWMMGSISHPIHKQRWYSLQHARDLYIYGKQQSDKERRSAVSLGRSGWTQLATTFFFAKNCWSLIGGVGVYQVFNHIYIYVPCIYVYILSYIHIITYNHIYNMCPNIRNPLNQVVGKSSICCFDGSKEVPKRFPKWWWFPW